MMKKTCDNTLNGLSLNTRSRLGVRPYVIEITQGPECWLMRGEMTYGQWHPSMFAPNSPWREVERELMHLNPGHEIVVIEMGAEYADA